MQQQTRHRDTVALADLRSLAHTRTRAWPGACQRGELMID
jgi:hypothetical protein